MKHVNPNAQHKPYVVASFMRTKAAIEAKAKKFANRENRRDYIRKLQLAFRRGEIMVDPDDPRTTRGLSDGEIAFIRGYKDSNEAEGGDA